MRPGRALSRLLTAVCMAVLLSSTTVFAAMGGNDESYTYTVTLYAGNQGSFTGTDGISVSGSGQIAYADGNRIQITGLVYGARVTVDVRSGMVALNEDSKYYEKGIRESGRDNNTVGNPSFAVTSDREYVIAYGIRGNMVSYQVNYVDAQGNTLAPGQTFYGVVGDRPVVAFQYIEGYRPQAYNLTGTLQSNEADNVFTFVYSPVQQPEAQQETGDNSQNNTADGTAETTDATAGTGEGSAGSTTAGTTGTAGTGTADTDADTAITDGTDTGAPAGDEDTGADAGTDDSTAENDGTPEDLIDIDEDETPLGNLDATQESAARPAGNMPLFIAIAIVAAAGIAAIAFLVVKNGRKHK